MVNHVLPVLYALFVWWFSTGAIIYLDKLPSRTFRWSMLGATLVLAWSVYGLATSSTDASAAGAYTAFTCGLLVWGWQEMSFFMGVLTGPRARGDGERAAGWRHFGQAILACLYHELAIIVAACAVTAVTWRGPNHVGLWTFMILWGMRQSAKLNVFLGVLNLNEQFLPERMAFVKRFLTCKPMNLLFPVSVTLATVIVTLLVQRAASAATAFDAIGFTFLSILMVLAILEHWFLVLPLPFAALWNWYLGTARAASGEKQADPPAWFKPRRAFRLRRDTAASGAKAIHPQAAV